MYTHPTRTYSEPVDLLAHTGSRHRPTLSDSLVRFQQPPGRRLDRPTPPTRRLKSGNLEHLLHHVPADPVDLGERGHRAEEALL